MEVNTGRFMSTVSQPQGSAVKYALASLRCAAAASVLLVSGMVMPMAMGINVLRHCSHPAVPSCIHTILLALIWSTSCNSHFLASLHSKRLPCFKEDGAWLGLGSATLDICPGLMGSAGRSGPFSPAHQPWTEIHLNIHIPSQNAIVFTIMNESHQFCLLFQGGFAGLMLHSYCLCCRGDKATALFSVTAIYNL